MAEASKKTSENLRTRFWELPLSELNIMEWEALCDGCGKCCLVKFEDADTGIIYGSNLSCKLLDLKKIKCKDYANRRSRVADCTKLNIKNVQNIDWLPKSCAYRLRAQGRPIPAWHPLLSGDMNLVHHGGHSVYGKAISEENAGEIEEHLGEPITKICK